MEKKKILHIVESFASGVFSFLVDLVNSTDEEFEILIAYGVRIETPDNFKDYFSNRVKFVKVENFIRKINPIKDFKALLEIKKIIKDFNPDIIHLHSSKAGFIGRFAVNCNKVKMFYNPHGFSFLMQDKSKIKRLMYWWIEKIGTLRKCTIVGCSQGEYEEALKLSKNSICINNGINIEKIQEEIKDFKEKEVDFSNLKICTSGRIGYQKNPELFNKIAEAFPNFQFTWIGDGELRDKLTSSNITVTGWKERKEVLKIVNDNDIFILTSLWEGLPISLLEAMYLKKLCIVTDCIGNRDVIKKYENGLIANNLDDFKNNIQQIINKNIKFNFLIKISHEHVIKNYNINIMIKEYEKLYSNLR